jgi:hypothetical protein
MLHFFPTPLAYMYVCSKQARGVEKKMQHQILLFYYNAVACRLLKILLDKSINIKLRLEAI